MYQLKWWDERCQIPCSCSYSVTLCSFQIEENSDTRAFSPPKTSLTWNSLSFERGSLERLYKVLVKNGHGKCFPLHPPLKYFMHVHVVLLCVLLKKKKRNETSKVGRDKTCSSRKIRCNRNKRINNNNQSNGKSFWGKKSVKEKKGSLTWSVGRLRPLQPLQREDWTFRLMVDV